MFHLVDRDGTPALMRNGEPFTYTTRELAQSGARIVSQQLGRLLKVVEN